MRFPHSVKQCGGESRTTRRGARAAAAVAITCLACAPELSSSDIPAVSDELTEYLVSASSDTMRPGRRAGDWIGSASAGLFLSPGRVVTLDFSPPFIKVFSGNGILIRSFLEKGEGPGQIPLAALLAVDGNGSILTGDAGRLLLFDTAGVFVRQYRTPFPFVQVSWDQCSKSWLAYGAARSLPGVPWLHTFRLGDSLELGDSFLRDTARTPRLKIGSNVLSSNQHGLAVLHENGSPPQLLSYPCQQEQLGTPTVTALYEPPPEADGTNTVRSGDRMLISVVNSSLGPVVVESIITDVRQGSSLTIMSLADTSGVLQVTVSGAYTLYDLQRGRGVLVGSREPVPHFISVPETLLINLDRMTPRRN